MKQNSCDFRAIPRYIVDTIQNRPKVTIALIVSLVFQCNATS